MLICRKVIPHQWWTLSGLLFRIPKNAEYDCVHMPAGTRTGLLASRLLCHHRHHHHTIRSINQLINQSIYLSIYHSKHIYIPPFIASELEAWDVMD